MMNTVKATLLSLALLALPGVAASEPSFAIAATHVLVDGDQVVDDALVLIADGNIVKVGPRAALQPELPEGLYVIEHDGWLSAGLVAVNSTIGLTYRDDPTSAFMDELELVLGFDPQSKAVTAARNLGVTSFGLVAGGSNVVGGVGAIAKADGTLLKRRSSLSICLSTDAVRSRRFPTSFGGALGALRARVAANEGSMKQVLAGDLYMSIAVKERSEMARAIGFAMDSKVPAVLRGAQRAGDLAEDLAAAKMSVALPPLRLGASEIDRKSMLALAKAKVPFAFGLADGDSFPSALRESAALAVRAGLDRGLAWRSVTSTAAQIMGVSDRVGRVAPGYDADLVLWSGDPLSLTSKPVAIYIDGKLTEGAKR